MTGQNIDVKGMPYFPGVAMGPLQRGLDGEIATRIVLISQDEVVAGMKRPAGVVVVDGAPFSHALIGLLALGVPTVLISVEQARQLPLGVPLLIDGSSGLISSDLDAVPASVAAAPHRAPGKPVLMSDGEAVNLCASVRTVSAARRAVEEGAAAIGLVRTEFLMPGDDSLPDAAFYRGVFRELCEAASPLTVTFRLLDVAADKLPDWLSSSGGVGQPLGLQGVRLWHVEPVSGVIDAQLRALAELTEDFSVQLLIPYLTRVEEFDYWLERIQRVVSADIAVGVMAETPASVLDIDQLLARADFSGIGCNDLMQSLFAADRDLPSLGHYLDPYAPVLYRLLRQVAAVAGPQVKDIRLCGVLAQQQGVLPVLLGLGFRTFSVDAPFIPHLARTTASLTRADCDGLAEQVCMATTTREVLEMLQLPTARHAPFLS